MKNFKKHKVLEGIKQSRLSKTKRHKKRKDKIEDKRCNKKQRNVTH